MGSVVAHITPAASVAVDRRRLNLGSGFRPGPKEQGWVNLDIVEVPGVDVIHDMTVFPWPFEDESFDVILAAHVFEKIPTTHVQYAGKRTDAFYAVMNECWRVLKPGGVMQVEVPTVGGNAAFTDQENRRYFVPDVWDFVARPVTKVPNTEAVRKGVAEVAALGCFAAVAGVLLGKPVADIGDQRLVAERVLGELKLNATRNADAAPHDWGSHDGDYNILCRFDCLVNIVDPGKYRFNFVVLRKPGVDG